MHLAQIHFAYSGIAADTTHYHLRVLPLLVLATQECRILYDKHAGVFLHAFC
jgi:hypothetical protein